MLLALTAAKKKNVSPQILQGNQFEDFSFLTYTGFY